MIISSNVFLMMKILFIFVVVLINCQLFVRVDAQVTYVGKGCVNSDNDTDFVTELGLSVNLGFLIANLTSKASRVKFYRAEVQDDPPYSVYGLFQCREDLSLDNCRLCVGDAVDKLSEVCPGVEGIVWYQECMLRYAAHSNFLAYETYPSYIEHNTSTITKNSHFAPVLASAMDILIDYTASTSPLHYAASESILTSTEKLYCFAQCTPDSDDLGCIACLRSAFSQVMNCCSANTRVMVFLPSCQLRYDNKSFWLGEIPLAPPAPAPPPPINQDRNKNKTSLKAKVIVAIAIAATIGLVLLVAGVWLCQHKRRQRQQLAMKIRLGVPEQSQNESMDDIKSLESLQFDFKMIKAATNNFSDKNKLGQGGFGVVYKGKLSNGEEIAVKRLSRNSEQGISEFKNEVLLVAELQHRNLVRLLGFCISRNEQILIYEFLSNSSLDRFLYDPVKRASLDWELRFKIITGVARGLLYLHEDSRLKIIHRDMKASNILLDDVMNAKIADFGLAKLFDLDQTQGDTGKIAGTYGYMAPEYAMAGHFSVKSDVYSFGVIVLEIVSGQRNGFRQQPEEGLLHRAWRLWNEETIMELVDPLLSYKVSEEEVKLCVLIALLCIQDDANQRPRMTSVVAALNGESVTLPLPNAPHVFTIGVTTDTTICRATMIRC